MFLKYLNCVFNCVFQSQHGIWEMLQHVLPNTEKNELLKLTDISILPSSYSETCIAEYVRIPSYKYEYICLRYWLLHALACMSLVMQAKERGSQNTPCMSISHRNEMMVFRPLLCTLFRLNWAKQTPGIMRRN